MRRRAGFLGVAGIAACILVTSTGAGAQVYPPAPPACSIQLSASTLRADQTFTVTGTQAEPNVPVDIVFESTPVFLASTTTDANGAFQVDAKVPAGAEPGPHVVRVLGAASCPAEVVVEPSGATSAAQGQPGGPSLAFTGANLLALVLLGLVALTVGFVFVAGERRQRSRRSVIRRERRMRRAPAASITP